MREVWGRALNQRRTDANVPSDAVWVTRLKLRRTFAKKAAIPASRITLAVTIFTGFRTVQASGTSWCSDESFRRPGTNSSATR